MEGEKESRIAGAALKELGAAPVAICSSPLVRARQTAEIAARALSFDGEVEAIDELENGASTPALLQALKSHRHAREILLVGHMPSLAGHVAALIGATLKDLDGLALGKGGVACVQVEELRPGSGRLRWLMRQDHLERLLG